MTVLRSLENMIAGAVEGTFSRVFRSAVRPVELARKLAREMEEHESVSLSHIYVPNEYRIYLSARDRAQFVDYEDELAGELSAYLLEHARREHLTLLSAPVIEFETDERLGLGQFGIATRVVDERDIESVSTRARSGQTMVIGADHHAAIPPLRETAPRQPRAVLLYNGRRLVVAPHGAVIGRSRECDVVVDDSGVSRRHAEIRPRGSAWVLTDLHSTNGTRLDGRMLERAEVIQPGDRIEVGSSVLAFDLD